MLRAPAPPAPTQRLVLSTDGLAPRDRFEWWRSQYAPLHATEVIVSQRSGFVAHGAHVRLGTMVVAHYVTPARRVVRTAEDVRRDDVDHFSLRVMLRGSVVAHGAQKSVRCRPGEVLFATSTESYRDEYSAGAWVALMAARRDFPALDAVRTGLVPGVQGRLLADYLVSLDRGLDGARPADLPALAEMTRAMIHGCLVGQAAPTRLDPVERRRVLRHGVERVIEANLGSARLDAARVGALAGISRSALYRLFEEEGGVASYVQARRLTSIAADLRDPQLAETPVSALAARRGLHNPAAFSRAFRRRFGQTPGEARAEALSAAASGGGGGPAQGFVDLFR